MKKIMIVTSIFLVAVLNSCQKTAENFEVQKIEAHERLDKLLQEIDDNIESIKIDTMQTGDATMKENLEQSEQKLTAMRENVLQKINKIDSVTKKEWDTFETSLDSAEVRLANELERMRDLISTLTQKPPTIPPGY